MKASEAIALANGLRKQGRTVQAESRAGMWGVNCDGVHFIARSDLAEYLATPLFDELKIELKVNKTTPQIGLFNQ